MTVPELLYIPYSPWSARALWALRHHGIEHRRRAYLTMIGEPGLRLRLGRLGGKVSVPVLFDAGTAVEGSFAIARWADRHGGGRPLFPKGDESVVRRWDERSDAILDAGRARTTARVIQDPVALGESLPPPMDKLGPLGLPVAKMGARFLELKYGMSRQSADEHLATMVEHLEALSNALDDRHHIVGDDLTYADITMAMALTFVEPPARSPLGPRSRELWSEPSLIDRFGRLLRWRDRLYSADS
jgi:glutathione S-transferase